MAVSDMQDGEFVGVPFELESSDGEEEGVVVDGHKHAKLLQAIGSLGSKKKPSVLQRTEATTKASEFNLAPGSGKVNIQELVGALKNTTGHGGIKKQLGKMQADQKLLNTPLAKHEKEKIQRKVAFEGTTEDLSKWEPIVKQNRLSEQLEFPLVKPTVEMGAKVQMAQVYKPRTPLEVEVAKLLAGSTSVPVPEKALTPAEERAMRAMSVQEAKERRAELQKYRALLTYKEQKARRQKKIKSKGFHRILRKERQKAGKKEMELLQEKDPEAYADKLMQLHRDRIEERMSLKHRGGSKFMKRQAIYGKQDDKTRLAVTDMLEKHQELRQRLEQNEGSSSEESDEGEGEGDATPKLAHRVTPSGQPITKDTNPWMMTTEAHEANIGAKVYTKLPEITNKLEEDEGETDEGEEGEREEGEEEKGESEEQDMGEAEEGEKEEQEKGKKDQSKVKRNTTPQTDLGIDDIFDASVSRVKKKVAQTISKTKKATRKREKQREKSRENKGKKQKKTIQKKTKKEESDSSDSSDEEGEEKEESKEKEKEEDMKISSSLTRKRRMEDFDNMSDTNENDQTPKSSRNAPSDSNTNDTNLTAKKYPQVDPNKFLTVTTPIQSSLRPEVEENDEEEEGGSAPQVDQQRLTIAQAFASDDVVREFRVEKRAAADEDKVKDIDLTLPGWGEWGGTGLKPSKKKRKRFVVQAGPAGPRRDAGMKGVIIRETKDNTIAKHQVKNLPFPFKSVHQFESSVRAPIGKTWNPEKSYRELIKPKIVTQMGTVIDPIDKDHVFKKKNSQFPDNNLTSGSSNIKKARKAFDKEKMNPKKKPSRLLLL